MREGSPAPTRSASHESRLDALWIGIAALALYIALGQRSLHGDGYEWLLSDYEGVTVHRAHLAYLPLLRAVHALTAPFGLSEFESARLASQLGAAIGVGGIVAAAQTLGATRSRAAWTGALVAVCPSVLFFATTVEVQATYLAFVGVAWLVGARLAARPTALRALVTGLVTGLAFLGHATGGILAVPVFALLWFWQAGRLPLLRRVALCAIGMGVHAAMIFALPALFRPAGGDAVALSAAEWLPKYGEYLEESPSALWWVLQDEWLISFAPLSVLWLIGLRAGPSRPVGLALAVALVPYLIASALLLAVMREFGAYQQPLAFLAALCVAWVLRAHWLALVAAAALAIGVHHIQTHDPFGRADLYQQGVVALADGRHPMLLIAGPDDVEACFIGLPDVPFVNMASMALSDAFASGRGAEALRTLDRDIAAHRRQDGIVYLTAHAWRFLSDPAAREVHPHARATLEHLERCYVLHRRIGFAFAGFELRPR